MKLTEREKKVLDAIARSVDAKAAANILGLSPSTVYNMLYRIRKKYVDARKFVNTILAYRRKSPKLDMVLSKRLKLDEEKLFGE